VIAAVGARTSALGLVTQAASGMVRIRQPMAPPRAVRVGAGAHIGPGAVILPGVRIGAGCYVAAGAVVAEDMPPHSVAAGNPAEVIRRWDPSAQSWIDSPDQRWQTTLRALSR